MYDRGARSHDHQNFRTSFLRVGTLPERCGGRILLPERNGFFLPRNGSRTALDGMLFRNPSDRLPGPVDRGPYRWHPADR